MKTIFRSLPFYLLIFAAVLSSQTTKPTVSQLAPTPGTNVIALVAYVPGTGVVSAPIDGVSLSYNASTGHLVVGGISPAPAFTEVFDEISVVDAPGRATLNLAHPGSITALHVWRNGLDQVVGRDYTLAGSVVMWANGGIPQVGDVLKCEYRFQ